MQFLLSTTGTLNPVSIGDFGARQFIHPTIDFDLMEENSEDEIRSSNDVQDLIDAGHIIIKSEDGNLIDNLNPLPTFLLETKYNGSIVLSKTKTINFIGDPVIIDSTSEQINVTVTNIPTSGSRNSLLNFSFGKGTKPYIKCNKKVWTVVGSFIFQGTAYTGTPSILEIIAWTKDNNTNGDVRLYDYTNSNEIASIEVNNETKQIFSNNSLSNLPTGKSIIEIQGRVNSRDIYLESLSLVY